MYATNKERPSHISYFWDEYQIGVTLLCEGVKWRTGLAYFKPLDAQPIEYAVKVVQVLMAMNKIARDTGGKEVPIESLAASPELQESLREVGYVDEEEAEEGAV